MRCWRRLLRVPWTARRSNQSILKEINPEYSLEGLMLQLWYFGHLMRRADSFEKTLMLRQIEGGRRRGWQGEIVGWHHWFDGHEFEQAPGVGDRQGSLACCSPWGRTESDTTEWLNWTVSIGNFIQYPVINYNEKEYEKEYVYEGITESLCCTPETNTMWEINYTSIRNFFLLKIQ